MSTAPDMQAIREAIRTSAPKRRYTCPGGDCLDLRCWAKGDVRVPNEVNGFGLWSWEGTPLEIAYAEDLTVPAERDDYENRFLADPTGKAYPVLVLPRPADRIEVEVVNYLGSAGRTLSLDLLETGSATVRPVPLPVRAMGVPQRFVLGGKDIVAIAFAGPAWVEAGIMRLCLA